MRIVSLDVRAESHKQVLRITDYVAERSFYRPRYSSSVSLARQDTVNSSQEAFEAVQEEIHPSLIVSLDFEGIGLSLSNRKLVEVVYLSVNKLKFEYTDSTISQAVNLTCGSVQIDNQMHDALFPVVLQPTPISKEANGVASLPTVQGSAIWLKDKGMDLFCIPKWIPNLTPEAEHGVFFVKYCSVLLQALTVEADEDFLYAIYDLTKIKGASWEEDQEEYVHSLMLFTGQVLM